MRLWSLHPRYLDARGLVALWREALLARAVLEGRTKGYTRHPQLARFREEPSPVGCIAAYLRGVHDEAVRRGYRFAAGKIGRARASGGIAVTRGQLDFEWEHLREKLARRDPQWGARLAGVRRPRPHPLFRVVRGPVAPWERGTLVSGGRHRGPLTSAARSRREGSSEAAPAATRRPRGRRVRAPRKTKEGGS